ncbi:MAG: circadian clock KaiB family protein [Aeromicrobium sp.]
MTADHDDIMARYEGRLAATAAAPYSLLLFVTGTSDMSMRAIRNLRELCETYLVDRYDLQVVDINRDASLMSQYDVVASPTLIKVLPAPARMLVGDLSDTNRVLRALDIIPPPDPRGGLDR